MRGCDQLIHAGDIGKPEILAELERLAPLSVVRGNNDTQDWAADIPERLLLKIGRLTLYVLHDLKRLDLDPAAEGIDVVVAGHSHKPLKEERDGVLYLNPGSAGPRRFSLPIGIGVLEVAGKKIEAELINDTQDWAADIPERLLLKIGRLTLYVLHDLKRLDLDPAAEGIDVVVAGHSHKPLKEERDGVLYLNPGSAGPRRFSLPIGIGVLEVAGKKIEAELITL